MTLKTVILPKNKYYQSSFIKRATAFIVNNIEGSCFFLVEDRNIADIRLIETNLTSYNSKYEYPLAQTKE